MESNEQALTRGVVLQNGVTGMAIGAPEPYTQAMQQGRLIWNGDKVTAGYRGIRINVLCPPGRSKEEVARLLRGGAPRLSSAPVRTARQRARLLGSVKYDGPLPQPRVTPTPRSSQKRMDVEALSEMLHPNKRHITLAGRKGMDYVSIISGQGRCGSSSEGKGRVVKIYMQSGVSHDTSTLKDSRETDDDVPPQAEAGEGLGTARGTPQQAPQPVTWRQGRRNTIVSLSNGKHIPDSEERKTPSAISSRLLHIVDTAPPRDIGRMLRKPLSSAGSEATLLRMRSGKPPDGGASRRSPGRREVPAGGGTPRQSMNTSDQLKLNGRQKTSDLSISPYFSVSVNSDAVTHTSREQTPLNSQKILVLRNAAMHPRTRVSDVTGIARDTTTQGRRHKRVVRFNAAAEVHEYDRFSPLHYYG